MLRTIDPAELGLRLRAARVAKGMTQTDLAGEEVSVGYVSRIEAGHRRPNLQVLTDLCRRLGTPVEQLLMGVAPQDLEHIRLTLDFAELSLESGQPQAAEAQAREARELAEAASLKDLVYRARYLLARSLEAQGFVDDAIIELESLIVPMTGGVMRIKAGIALSRCYRESGDFGRAVEVGEHMLEHLADTPLDTSDEAVQLAVTVAAAYYVRGDVGQAVRVCRKAMAKAENSRVVHGPGLGILEREHLRGWARRGNATRSRWPSGPWPFWPRDRTLATSPGCAPSSASCSCGWTRPRSRRPR